MSHLAHAPDASRHSRTWSSHLDSSRFDRNLVCASSFCFAFPGAGKMSSVSAFKLLRIVWMFLMWQYLV